MQTDNGNVVGNTLGGGDANKKQSPEDIRGHEAARLVVVVWGHQVIIIIVM